MKRRSLDRTLAKQFPERFFTSPLEIVGETLLTRGEKLGTLNRWHRALLDGALLSLGVGYADFHNDHD